MAVLPFPQPDGSRTERVMQGIRDRIDRRVLVPGAKIPSVRAMADLTGVSKSTVVEAYDRLAAEGVIRSRPGSGFYVAAPLAPLALDRVGPEREQDIDPLWMLRQSLQTRNGALLPGCGWLPEPWFEEDGVRRALRQIARAEAAPGVYSPAQGPLPLRTVFARRLSDQGVSVGPDQILLTDSGTHALDLICRFLLTPGQTVLVDDPCYFNFLALLRAHRVTVVAVPMTPSGPDPVAFSSLVTEHRPRAYLTTSAVHNPTGVTVAAATVHRILKVADQNGLVVIEDDIFADFEASPSPRYAAFDGLDRVIRIGSLSKSLSTGVRCGFIAANPDWIAALTDLRIATSMGGSALSANLLHTVLTDGSYRRHMDRVRHRLDRCREETLASLRRLGMTAWTEPSAGLFLWTLLPQGIDAVSLSRRALARNIVLAPGPVFSPAGGWRTAMRVNVAMWTPPALEAFFQAEGRAGSAENAAG